MGRALCGLLSPFPFHMALQNGATLRLVCLFVAAFPPLTTSARLLRVWVPELQFLGAQREWNWGYSGPIYPLPPPHHGWLVGGPEDQPGGI